jgi:hypothetical protein
VATLKLLVKEISEIKPHPEVSAENVVLIEKLKSDMIKHAQAPFNCPEAEKFWKKLENALKSL